MFRTRLLVASAAVAALIPVTSASAEPGIIAHAFTYFEDHRCEWPSNDCEGTPTTEHSALAGISLGGSGFLYVDGVLVASCDFGPGGSCQTWGSRMYWTWGECHVAVGVTILLGGDVDTDSDTTLGC